MDFSLSKSQFRLIGKNLSQLSFYRSKLNSTGVYYLCSKTPEPNLTKKLVTLKEARRFMVDCFKAVGTNDKNAEIGANNLLEADYRGHFSHGMNRLEMNLNDVEKGLILPNAEPKIEREFSSTALVNGNNGLGAVVGEFCMNLAIKKAESTGIGMVVCYHANHYGIAGYYVLQAIKKGYIGISFTNTSPLMVPTRANESVFGTNPISVGVPGCDGDMFWLDMATTGVAVGKLQMQLRKNQPLPKGWALNKDGEVETDTNIALEQSKLIPLGGKEENSGYKGYGLSMMIDVLAGALSGSTPGPDIRAWSNYETVANLAQGYIAINQNFFAPGVEKRLTDLMNRVRALKPLRPELPVLVPGDPERMHMRKVDAAGGLYYIDNQIKQNEILAKKYNIKPMEICTV